MQTDQMYNQMLDQVNTFSSLLPADIIKENVLTFLQSKDINVDLDKMNIRDVLLLVQKQDPTKLWGIVRMSLANAGLEESTIDMLEDKFKKHGGDLLAKTGLNAKVLLDISGMLQKVNPKMMHELVAGLDVSSLEKLFEHKDLLLGFLQGYDQNGFMNMDMLKKLL